MEILEAYDLTGSYRAAAELAGCDHHTVARYVKLRAEDRNPEERAQRSRPIDDFMDEIEELVARSGGRIHADVVHRRITAMGFVGGERTTRRAVAAVKKSWQAGQRRVFRPWIPEPGLWMQFDGGEGPRIGGRRTTLWCAWLSWSRFRVVISVLDNTLPTIVACLDATLRRLGGVPAYVLTDNEKTITVDHVADITIRNSEIVQVAVVLCVDEKSQTKALACTAPILPMMMSGAPQRTTPDYVRAGTSSLYAALNLATGKVIGFLYARTRAIEFKKFLATLDQEVPAVLDVHVVLDNASTYKTPAIKRWPAAHPWFALHFTPTSS